MGRAMDRLARLRAKGVIIDPEWDILAIRQDKHSEEYNASVKKVEDAKLSLQNFAEFKREASFISQGSISIIRHYQALRYDPDRREPNTITIYGMDCNPCCVMYLLQNYGLLPPEITRKEFEYLFTPLNPPDFVRPTEKPIFDDTAYSVNKQAKGSLKRKITFDGVSAYPLQKDIFSGLFSNTELFFRGFEGGGAILLLSNSAIILREIIKKFYQLSETKEYSFLKKYHNSAISNFNDNIEFTNAYNKLKEGFTSKSYFEQGNTIFVGLDEETVSLQHYCLIVSPKVASITIDKVPYHFYMADDPFYGGTYVAVPNTKNPDTIDELGKFLNKEINYGKKEKDKKRIVLKIISPNSAIGI